MTNKTDQACFDTFREVEHCPGCGASNARGVGLPGPSWDNVTAGRVFRHPEYEVKHCDACGLYFKTRVFDDAALGEYYSVLPFESFESNRLFPTDRLMLQAVASAAPGAKVLDFGCGVGRLLQRFVSRHRCFGVEVNERACEVARAAGITILPEADIRSGAERDFDFVILSDVFEHLPNPLEFLRPLAAVLKPGGALIISTGNGDAVRCREYLSLFWYFRVPGHLQMLSPKHLNWCAGELGLELADCQVTSHYDTPWRTRVRQHLQTFAFEQFHLRPHAALTRILRWLPGLRRAEHWPLSPILTCTRDHLVAVLRKR